MLKRNLIIVAVISLSVFLTSNAFGQNNKRKRTTTKPKVATATPNTTATNARIEFQSQTRPHADGLLLDIKKKTVKAKSTAQYNPKEMEVDKSIPSTTTTNARTTNPTAKKNGRYANDDIGTYPNIISKKPTTNAKTTKPQNTQGVMQSYQEIKKKMEEVKIPQGPEGPNQGSNTKTSPSGIKASVSGVADGSDNHGFPNGRKRASKIGVQMDGTVNSQMNGAPFYFRGGARDID